MNIDAREIKNDINSYVNKLYNNINDLELQNGYLEYKVEELQEENKRLKQKLQGVQA